MKKQLGEYIRQYRNDHDLSLRELAKRIGCSPAFLSDVELGRRYPTDKRFFEIAEALGITMDELRKYDTRPPIKDVRRLTQTDPNYAFAFRKLIDKEVSSDELLKFIQGLNRERKKKKEQK